MSHADTPKPATQPCNLTARRLGIETLHEAHVFLRKDSFVSRAEGFSAHTRILVCHGDRSIVATLYHLTSDLIGPTEIGLSESAWLRLALNDGDNVSVGHAPPVAAHRHVVTATRTGIIEGIDNRRLARVAKLAGAPEDKAAGLEIHVRLGEPITEDQPLYTIHAESPGELSYALEYAGANPGIVAIARS